MIYFDNAATSFPKAPGVAGAITTFLAESAANPGRSGHRMAVAAERMLDDVRLRLTRLFDGDDHHRMVFAMNTTDALNMAIKGVLGDERPSAGGRLPHVITTVLEHNSVSRQLEAMREDGQIELTRVTCDDEGFVDPGDIKRAITPATKLIVMTHASNVLGTIQDAAAVGRIAREHGVLFCLDAAQTAGAIPISITELNVDLLAFPGHKSLLGPTGTGGLYVGSRCPEPAEAVAATIEVGHQDKMITRKSRLRAWREGGTGGDSSTTRQPTLYPYYLEGGTPNTVGIAGLAAGLDYIEKHGIAGTLAHEQAMVKTIIDRIADDKRFTLYGTRDASRRVGAVAFNIAGYEPSDVGSILDTSFDIAARPGLHCSPYCHKRFGTHPSGALRVSPGPFNTAEELDALLDALNQIAG
ncbi:MAG: aminotransferase class V-fold PLP-dependent enzyme [Planctomycetes bacterium]|nr:aminotransferase class V-fold PLP-dependent enzyme [Planctomycetota bacterium]